MGSHAREVIVPALAALDHHVTAVCDIREDGRAWGRRRFADAYSTSGVEDDEFWNRVDCVVACATPQVHEVVLTESIRRRKHCFCEKPAAVSAKTLQRLAGLHEKLGSDRPVIRIGHNFRYTSGGARFIGLLSNHLRRIQLLSIWYVGAGPRGSRWGLPPRDAFALTHLTHAIDFVLAAVGNVESFGSIFWAERDGVENVAFTLQTKRCGLVNVSATNAAAAFTCGARAVFDDGSAVELDSLRSVTWTGFADQGKRAGSILRERDLGTLYQNDSYGEELTEFFAEARGSQACRLPDLRTAAASLQIVEDIVRGDEPATCQTDVRVG